MQLLTYLDNIHINFNEENKKTIENAKENEWNHKTQISQRIDEWKFISGEENKNKLQLTWRNITIIAPPKKRFWKKASPNEKGTIILGNIFIRKIFDSMISEQK